MRFDHFIGNSRVIERLRLKLREGRFPHGLIFTGPEGVGKRTCALMIAKALNCSQAEAGEFCDECTQCRKIDAGTHPDVLSVGLEDEAAEIKIAQIRTLLQTLELRPLEGRNKVFLIDPADAMNAASSNALLKGLEEPPENSYFILLSPNPQSLLVTVRSRSQTYPFVPLTVNEMRTFSEDELALRWSRGSIGQLKTLDLDALRERRSAVLDFLETAIHARDDDFRSLIGASADLSRSKTDFQPNMDVLAVLVEDLLYLREGLAEKIINIDLEKELSRLADEVSPEQFVRIADFLRTIEIHTNNYGNRQMLIDVLALTSNAAVGKLADDFAPKSR
jgi:DNA polymerase III subunit delta'